MSLSFSLYKPPLPPQSSSSKPPHPPPSLTTPFLHGRYTSNFSLLTQFSTLSLSSPTPSSSTSSSPFFPVIKAMKSMQGRVICTTNDKTVAVEVTRLAPHPKYKRRVRKKKKYQAHDPDNQFKVGDWVQLEKCRPISKTKAFLAVVPVARKNVPKVADSVPGELGLPLESRQLQEQKI